MEEKTSSQEKGFYVYLLRCSDDTLYAGWTTDPAYRLNTHNEGKGAKYTRSRRPVALAYLERCQSKQEACRREADIKRMPRVRKLALIEAFGKG